ncbi:MAG: mandelate racemase/muconate lactonizing enzyme family protein [Pseudomonadota bacterium]
MKVTGIDVRRYGEPSGGDFEIIVVEVESDAGHRGMGYQLLFGSFGRLVAQLIIEQLAPSILNEDPWHTNDLWERMNAAIPRRSADGFVRGSIAAIDVALWDLKAKEMNAPVSKLLGGSRERVRTYANCAHNLPPDQLGAKALEYVQAGHRALKVRGTSLALNDVAARIEAVRDAVGPDVRLMVDVNGTWDVDTAIQQLKRWERFDVYWLEEPVAPSDIAGYARIRERAGNTYIVGGEQHVGLSEFRALIDNRAVDIVQPNVAITGGVTDWLRIHSYATALGIPVSPWNMQAIHIHMATALPNVQWVEYFMPDNPLLALKAKLFSGPVIEEEVRPDGVYLKPPAMPGFGLSLDPETAAACRLG